MKLGTVSLWPPGEGWQSDTRMPREMQWGLQLRMSVRLPRGLEAATQRVVTSADHQELLHMCTST